MELKNLGSNKQEIAKNEFKKLNNNNTQIELCGTKFEIMNPNFNGGSIYSNCTEINGVDLQIINSFNLEKLKGIESDLLYLQKLINARKKELLSPQTITELNTYEDKKGNKKIYYIQVTQYIKHTDIYGDSNRLDRDKIKILEQFKFSNTKPYQEDIQNKIKELKIKYNLE